MYSRIATFIIAASAIAGTFAPGRAEAQIAALNTGGDKLYIISEDAKGPKVAAVVKLQVKTNDRILAIDRRVEDGAIYGLSARGNIYKLNPKNGKVNKLFRLALDLSGTVSMDCNPVADACRIVSDKGLNARFTFTGQTAITDPKLSFAAGAGKPRVIAIAYTNSFPGAETTELFDVDAETDKLYQQNPPNSGVLNLITKIKPKVEKPLALDIVSFGPGNNAVYIIYQKQATSFDFSTGQFVAPTKIRGLDEAIKDLTILSTN